MKELICAPNFLERLVPFLSLREVFQVAQLNREIRQKLFETSGVWTALMVRYRLGLQKGDVYVHDLATRGGGENGSSGGWALAPHLAANVVLSIVGAAGCHGTHLHERDYGIWKYDKNIVAAARDNDDIAAACCCLGGPPIALSREDEERWLIARRLSAKERENESIHPHSPQSPFQKHLRLVSLAWFGCGNTIRNIAAGDYYVMWRTNWSRVFTLESVTWVNECFVQCALGKNQKFDLRSGLEEKDRKITLRSNYRRLPQTVVASSLKNYGWIDLRMDKVHIPTVEEAVESNLVDQADAERGLNFSVFIDLQQRDGVLKSGFMADFMYLWPVEPSTCDLPSVFSERDAFPVRHSAGMPSRG